MFEYLLKILPSLLLASFCVAGLIVVLGRKHSMKRTLLIVIPSMLGIFILNLGYFGNMQPLNYENWFILTVYLPASLICVLIGNKKGVNALTACVHVFLSFYIIYLLKNVTLTRVNSKWPEYVIYVIFFPLLLYYLRNYYLKLQNDLEEFLPNYVVLILLYGIFLFIEILIYRTLINTTSAHVLRLEIFGVAIISVYVVSVAGFYLIIKQYKKRIIEINQQSLINRDLHALEDQLNLRRLKDNELKIIRHDMKHILINISSLIKNGKYVDAMEFANQYVDNIDLTSEKIYCNDPVINSILDYYKKICVHKDITLNIKTNNFEDALNISSNEMGVFISNCLDNAMNAVLKLEKEQRIIDFTFINNNDRLVLQIKNNFNGSVILDSNNKPTSMSENHGIGTSSINYFAEKNGLILSYDITDKAFTINVLFTA